MADTKGLEPIQWRPCQPTRIVIMLLKIVRNVLGYSIAAVDLATRGKALKRSAEDQAKVDAELKNMALYHFPACPFCIKTRRAMYKLGLKTEVRDAMNDAQARSDLEQQGGKIQVPCLRISEPGKDDVWLYESGDIISFLQKKFA